MLFFHSTVLALLSAPLLALAQSDANPFKIPVTGFSASAGSPLTLSWTPTTDGTVSFVLRTGNSANLDQGTVIASNVQNSGSYTWQVPSDVVRGSDYTVEIVSDSDSSAVNFTPYFVIDSSVTVATTSASAVSLGAPTSSIVVSSALPTASAVGSSGLNSVLSTASISGSASSTSASGASTTGSSTLATSARASGSSSGSASASSSGSAAAGFQPTSTSATQNGAPKATAMAGLMGVLALGALAL